MLWKTDKLTQEKGKGVWLSSLLAAEEREGGSRGGGLSGQERTGLVMTLLVAPTLGPSCHSGYVSREGFYL